jgi:hypothetical protein
VSDLPKWVYDLVIALQKHEDEHAKESACLESVLALVPNEVTRDADAIRHYVAMATVPEATP